MLPLCLFCDFFAQGESKSRAFTGVFEFNRMKALQIRLE